MKDLVLLAQFSQLTMASIVKSFLESRGVHSVIEDSATNSIWAGSVLESNIRMYIQQHDLKEALTLMKEAGFDEFVTEE